MKKTGELLRKTREEKGLSVHEVGLFLKINPRILQAMEEGDQSQLPAKTFLRGFIQSYAKFLKLDVQEVLRLFADEISPAANPAPVIEKPVSPADPESLQDEVVQEVVAIETPPVQIESSDIFKNSVLTKNEAQNDVLRARTIAISIIGLLLVIIVYFVNSVIKKYQKEAQIAPEVTATLQNVDSTTPPTETSVTVDPSKSSSVSPQATAVTTSTPTSPALSTTSSPTKPATVTAPVSPIKPIAIPPAITPTAPTAVKPVTPTPTPVVAKQVTPPAPAVVPVKPVVQTPPTPITATPTTPGQATAPVVKPPEGKLTEVIIEATQNVEIEYSSSKSPPQKLVLKPDQIHTFKSRSGVRLKISNGGGVNVIVNGQDRGAPGAAGQPVQVSYE